jgi:ADP-heptose:LPS heptosyltransferase
VSNPFRVAFAWKGSKDHKNDRNRSTSLKLWLPLFAIQGIHWVCVQQEITEPEKMLLEKLPNVEIVGRLTDWADTATVLSQVDAVIAVDTGLVHLSGALGIPTCVLIAATPDFRHLLAPRSDSVWYKSWRLMRQPTHGDWGTPFTEIAARLTAVIQDHESRKAA